MQFDFNGNPINQPEMGLRKILWSELGKVVVPDSLMVITKDGHQVPMPETVKKALREGVGDAMAVFQLVGEFSPEFTTITRASGGIMGFSLDENGNPFLEIAQNLLGDDWLDNLKKTTVFNELVEQANREIKEYDIYKLAEVFFLGSIAHEMYHVRQYIQDLDYFVQTLRDNNNATKAGDEFEHYRLYWLSQGERSARVFEIKYLSEKLKDNSSRYSQSLEYSGLIKILINLMIEKEKRHSAMSQQIRDHEERMRQNSIDTLVEMYHMLEGESREYLVESAKSRGFDLEAYVRSLDVA